jgi:hypothetical protein
MTDEKDRRRHPRAEARLSAGVLPAGAGGMMAVTTLNVGEGGVYVEVPRFIEPLTKLQVTLDLQVPAAPCASGTGRSSFAPPRSTTAPARSATRSPVRSSRSPTPTGR